MCWLHHGVFQRTDFRKPRSSRSSRSPRPASTTTTLLRRSTFSSAEGHRDTDRCSSSGTTRTLSSASSSGHLPRLHTFRLGHDRGRARPSLVVDQEIEVNRDRERGRTGPTNETRRPKANDDDDDAKQSIVVGVSCVDCGSVCCAHFGVVKIVLARVPKRTSFCLGRSSRIIAT